MQIQLWSRVFLTRFLTETSRDGAGGQGFREPVKTIGAGEMRRIGCVGTQGLWPCVLITRRSQVQSCPPLLRSSSSEALSPCERASCFGSCSQMCSQNPQGIASKPTIWRLAAARSSTNATSENAIAGWACGRSPPLSHRLPVSVFGAQGTAGVTKRVLDR
jgi:hypothetical protein